MNVLQRRRRESQPKLSRSLKLALIPFTCLLLLGMVVAFFFSPLRQIAGAHASGTVQLPGHVPALVKHSQLLGATDPNTPLSLTLGLQLRNQAVLASYVSTISQAHVTSTHRYLTPDQIANAFGPLPASTQAVIDYMQQAGFTVTTTYKNHLLIGFQGTVGQADNAFQVQINNYRAPNGRIFFASASNPSVPQTLGGIIQTIGGLDNAVIYTHPPIPTVRPTAHVSANLSPNTACAPTSAGYTPGQIASAYNLTSLYNAGFHGEGQTVALFELDDYSQSDISTYTACYGGASVPISRILVDGGSGKIGAGAIEVELDMELVLSAAPHLAGLRVYEAPNTSAAYLAEWGQIVNDAVPVVSTSWGVCEPGMTSSYANMENSIFMVAAAQGQSIFAAAGDHGTADCSGVSGVTFNSEAVDDPASQPYVTSVGGTTLNLGTNNSYGNETVWNRGIIQGQFSAGGGGISSFWTAPTWQQGPGVVNQYSSKTVCNSNGAYCREVPDVAFDADPYTGYPVYCTVTAAQCSTFTPWLPIGGTSAAAPMWAAFTALANEKSLHDGNFNLGFLNPLLYQIGQNASGTNYANDFHDITQGNNAAYNDGKYPATPNYDMASGLGSLNAAPLANDLETLAKNQTNARSAPANTTWYFAEGSVGHTFAEYITLLNPSANQAANVAITYLFENKPAVTVQHTVPASARYTVSANADLNIPTYAAQQAISAIVNSNIPVVAERPMYFSHGVASGTDAVGATNATHTTFYFAESDTRQNATQNYHTYITMLNPSTTQSAHVVITYYSQGRVAGTENVTVGPLQRGTATPAAIGLYQQLAVKVTSDLGIVVERPMYVIDNIPNAGGPVTGAASAVGATSTGNDWLFAEGYTGTNFQEYLVLANFGTAATSVNVKLEYGNGTFQIVPVSVPAMSQYYFDVNNAHANPVAGCNCTPTNDVSAEVTASATTLVAERLMYFHFGGSQLPGITDVVGEAGPTSHNVYAFAEGYTNSNFSEYLTLQNPNNNAESVALTFFADNTIVQEIKVLPAHSRTTVSVSAIIYPLATAYPSNPRSFAYEVSMDVQALSGTVVAERPMYFNYSGDLGGTDVIGYVGG